MSLKILVLSLGILSLSCSPARVFTHQGKYIEIPLEEAWNNEYVQVDIKPTNPETRRFYATTSFKNGLEFTREYDNQLKLAEEVKDSINSSYPETNTAIINERFKGRWTLGILAGKLGIEKLAFF